MDSGHSLPRVVSRHLLVFFPSKYQQENTVILTDGLYFIGRDSKNSIFLDSPFVSRLHATLVRKESPENGETVYILVDGDLRGKRSQNGTFVNGQKIIQHTLKTGDVIVFGSEENKAVYKRENISASPPADVIKKISSITREKLQDTLIVSELNLKERLHSQNIEHLASFPELSPNPILEFDSQGNLLYCNPAARICFEEIVEGKTQENPLLMSISYPDNLDPQQSHLLIREIEYNGLFYEEYIHFLCREKVIRIYAFDITERKKYERELKYQAIHDSLTGLPNREFFYQKLEEYLRSGEEGKVSLAILFIDVDRFKNVNDTLSHTVGDKLLQQISYRLKTILPTNCVLARWGGDEFIVLMPIYSKMSALFRENNHPVKSLAEAIISKIKQPFFIDNHNIYVTCSIGISIYPTDGSNETTLVKNADMALYRAKHLGRDNYQFYTNRLGWRKMFLFELENSLYQAMNNRQFFLSYQPQLDLKTNRIEGVEVLLRWQHPILGIVSPSQFIPLAEETGLIISIGEWVLKQACETGKKWLQCGYPPLTLSVNVSAKQFQTDDFANKLKTILEETQFPPDYLELEITESILLQDVQQVEKTLSQLAEIGVKLSLDDFGTGYSSFGYLKKFPFDSIKIDKSFVDGLCDNKQDRALVAAIITLARGYGMKVVAEGVETENQKRVLEELDCDVIQGYLVGKPLTEEELLERITTDKGE
ncbi:MAG: EAL domain-containing protein [Geminocystis sp.]|nr:EAL domain-containing protein [Geminocystis sp.]HIK36612.1 EAL domain-containing protein [Geminocystis sp. M7585_C2015_104]MCS7147932.1 EAL domain-containing protein [Geminocystis sp.]MCX8078759.1 EAL domain-containing protein [Geminocystis sp.]MDW8116873.1 EAL domain-containing protein [Geminocystis sp.]